MYFKANNLLDETVYSHTSFLSTIPQVGVTSQLDWTLVSSAISSLQPNLSVKRRSPSLRRGLGEVAKTLTTEILLKNQTIKPSLSILIRFCYAYLSKNYIKAQLGTSTRYVGVVVGLLALTYLTSAVYHSVKPLPDGLDYTGKLRHADVKLQIKPSMQQGKQQQDHHIFNAVFKTD